MASAGHGTRQLDSATLTRARPRALQRLARGLFRREPTLRGGLRPRTDHDEACEQRKPPRHVSRVPAVNGGRECLDHVIVANATGLHRVLTEYVEYHTRSRTHLALDRDSPMSRPVMPPSAGRIVATPQVGGLHHRYDRAAA